MDFQALVIGALLMRASVSVSGSSEELSTTTGDTVHIPCLFGEGTLRNIYWYYNDGTGPVKILTFFKGTVTKGGAYVYRASLHDDNSTLILTNITVKDEGTYRCDVDREEQTAVPNVNTKLNVFSLTRYSLPKIAECTEIDESNSACNIHSWKSITVSCELRNAYPVEDAELSWYQDEQHVPSTGNPKPNDDGTFDITETIQVFESGNFTCNTTFFTAEGAEKRAVYVGVRITPETDTPGQILSKGSIAAIVVAVVVFVVACLVIIIFCRKKLRHPPPQKNPDPAAQPLKGYHTPQQAPEPEAEPVQGRNKRKDTNDAHSVPLNTSDNREDDPVEQPTLSLLARKFPVGKFEEFCFELNREYNEAQKVLKKHSTDYEKALMEILIEWKTRTGGHRSVLVAALQNAGVGGLLHYTAETTRQPGPESNVSLQGQDEVDMPCQNGNPENNQGSNSAPTPVTPIDATTSTTTAAAVANATAPITTASTTSTSPPKAATTRATATTPTASPPRTGSSSAPSPTTTIATAPTTTATTTTASTPNTTNVSTTSTSPPQAGSTSAPASNDIPSRAPPQTE